MSDKNLNVLKFYEQMPFNVYGNLDSAVNQIKKNNEYYPGFFITVGKKVL